MSGVGIFPTADGFHVGVVYRESGGASWLHLAWHLRLTNEPWDISRGARLYQPRTRKKRWRRQLAGVCATVRTHRTLSYGFDAEARIEEDGRVVPLGDTGGLTCATFVTSLYRRIRLPLVDETTWSKRDTDSAFRARVIKRLESQGASVDHLNRLRAAEEWGRIQPDEVAGACLAAKLPADMATCAKHAATVRNTFQSASATKDEE